MFYMTHTNTDKKVAKVYDFDTQYVRVSLKNTTFRRNVNDSFRTFIFGTFFLQKIEGNNLLTDILKVH